MAAIFDSIAEGVVLAVGELAEIRLAVTKHHCDVSHSPYNRGVKAAVTTMAETVAGIRTAAMTVNTVTVAAKMRTSRLKIAVAGQYNCGCNCCNYNS